MRKQFSTDDVQYEARVFEWYSVSSGLVAGAPPKRGLFGEWQVGQGLRQRVMLRRWVSITQKLLDEHQWQSEIVGADHLNRETPKKPLTELTMRRAWGSSMMKNSTSRKPGSMLKSQPVNVSVRKRTMRLSMALPMHMKINEAKRDNSFLSMFVVGPQSHLEPRVRDAGLAYGASKAMCNFYGPSWRACW